MTLDLENWQEKTYRTREGEKFRVLCVNANGPKPVVAQSLKTGHLRAFYTDGKCGEFWYNGEDLINSPPAPVTITRWLNVFKTGPSLMLWDTEAEAREQAENEAARQVPVSITYTPLL
jgi:hypothetical protein